MSWRRWNWLDDGLLPLGVVVLRTCWLWPWLRVLQHWMVPAFEGHLLSVGLVFGLLLAGVVTARQIVALAALWARVGAAVVGLMVIFLVLWARLYRPQYPLWDPLWLDAWSREMTTWAGWETKGVPVPVFALLAMAFLWLRGLLIGGRLDYAREHVWHTFVAGFVALVLLLMVGSLEGGWYPDETSNLVWLFFATGMAGLALSGLKMAGGLDGALEAKDGDTRTRPLYDRYWLGSVVSVIGTLLALGMLFSMLVAPEALKHVLGSAWVVVRQGIIYLWIAVSLILYPLAYIIALLLMPLMNALIRASRNWRLEELSNFGEDLERLRPGDAQGGQGLFDALPDQVRWVALGLMILLIALAFALALRRLLTVTRIKDGIEETRELVLSRDLLGEQLAGLWRDLLGRMRRARRRALSPFLSLEGEPDNRRTIRAIYQALLARTREVGRPRLRSQTPTEYGRVLQVDLPEGAEPLEIITTGYVEARYAPDAPTAEQAQRVSGAWTRLQGVLTVLDGEGPGEEA